MPLTKLFTKKDLINYVKDVLESQEYDVEIIRNNPKYDFVLYKGGEEFVVKIYEKYQLKPSGTINKNTKKNLLYRYRDLLTSDFSSPRNDARVKIKKILVLTNNQVFNEVAELLKTNFLKDKQTKTDVQVMLIRFPIFKNNFAENCSNKLFTVPQLIAAIKSGVVKLENLTEDKRDFIIGEMKRHGYKIKRKSGNVEELDFSSLEKDKKWLYGSN